MTEIAIRAENLSKQYRIGGKPQGYRTLRETLAESFAAPFRRLSSVIRSKSISFSSETIWALKDVSFEIERGEVVGIIGRNGAGKTTLLKIISRITEPTEGYAEIRGRVGALLEVGTGFHPELTGRENIYLNGSILGMKRLEIERKFDEIVAFAEIERFLDTPVKHYSSGMYVRLAFAVAAHLEPEILLVDEVLAVGDAAFQKKCLEKVGKVADEGRTVLFVSHNMGVIREIASRGIWLNEGKIFFDGDIKDTVAKYLSSGLAFDQVVVNLTDHPRRLPGMRKILNLVSCKLTGNIPCRDFSQDDDIVLEAEYRASDSINIAAAGFNVKTIEGVRVGGYNTYMAYPPPHKLPQCGKITFVIAARQFTPGTHLVTVSLASHPGVLEDQVESAISFVVHPADIYGTGYLLTHEDGVTSLEADTHIEDTVEY